MAKEKETPTVYKKWIRRFWWTLAIGFIAICLFFTGINLGLFGKMPSFRELENPETNLASEIYSADQVLLGKFYHENRSNVYYSELSPNVVNALVAVEDVRFQKHSGVDARSIGRVLVKTIIGGSSGSGGGSTISQQLAKNLFKREERKNKLHIILIKLKEWVTAIKLEKSYSKEEIVAMYLNTVDFGSQSFGIKSASRTFFNTTPDSLKIEEAAMLVGMLKAPTRYSPVLNPDNALDRRHVCFVQMRKAGFISKAEMDSLDQIPLDMSKFKLQDHNQGLATYFREHLRMELREWCETHEKPNGENYNIYTDGLRIYTTINSKMQMYAEQAVEEHLSKDLQPTFYKHWKGIKKAPFWNVTENEIDEIMQQAVKRSDRYRVLKKADYTEEEITESFNTPVRMQIFSWNGPIDTVLTPMDSIRYYKWFLLAGLMSVEPQTGYVRAYVGGINYRHFKYDHVTKAKRQVGSTFKPFVYAIAMQEREYSPCSKVPNVPVTFEMPDGKEWTPKNSGKYKEGQMITLKEALANSINWISAYLIKRYSPQAVANLAKKMGVESDIPAVPAICLGTPDISLYEMVGATSTYANKGRYIKPIFITRIEDKNGNVIESFVPESHEAVDEETAYIMINLMQGVVQSGTSVRLRYKYQFTNEIAGKTGTTDNNSDGWFMGIVPNLVTGVWVGAEDRSVHFRYTKLGQGANMALPIWALYMQKVYADPTLDVDVDDTFEKPKGELSIELNCTEYNKMMRNENNQGRPAGTY